ncbi:hypothetical protein PHYBOEH_010434 [Phytophthora boehmeriae]|uniref:GRIP domain-containing protein n=1 Tax=Phytophthora boehmeriae TaxID=109152 RepID=A0A8T1WXF1_9STRA|nr:hypothetical protein PHYBOEH_010434 [Phytophthora boehmeriae]
MWSRLTEGLADIVAPEDGAEQEREQDGDELWSRFAAVVAPPPLSAAAEEDDEKEQYICELERALLQRKKANEALEKKISDLENRAGEERQWKRQVREQEAEIAQQKATIERLQAARNEAVALQSEDGETSGTDRDRLVQELQQSQAQTDELALQCQSNEKELVRLRDRVEELLATVETLQDDEREARSRAAEYEQGYMDLLAEMEKIKTAHEDEKAALMAKSEEHASSIDSQRLYDLEAQLSASEADKAVALKDAERLQRNLDSLEGVLHQFQVDSKLQKERVAEMEAELEQAREEIKSFKASPTPTNPETDDLERVMAQLVKKTHECEQLREALESTATQYNSDRDVLDKRLAAQLVVAYVDSNKKSEVLQLMARMMGFTEEQKRRVGVGYPVEGNGGGGLFSSIIGLVAPGDNANVGAGGTGLDPAAIEGKSFADMWSDFLLEEASKGK